MLQPVALERKRLLHLGGNAESSHLRLHAKNDLEPNTLRHREGTDAIFCEPDWALCAW